jgi:hypothetical protein
MMRPFRLASVMLALAIAGQVSAQEPKRLKGVDLFVDLKEYVGIPVILLDGTVYGASNDGATVKAGSVYFRLRFDGADRENLRFFLSNCGGVMPSNICSLPLLVTPMKEKLGESPMLGAVKIMQ